MSKSILHKIIIGVIALITVGVILAVYFKPEPKLPKPVAINTSNQPTLGNPKAKVHIVAFEDLKCANCMRFNTTLLPKIKNRWINTGQAKYTFINLAFIPGSMPAANAARCVYAQNKKLFFPFIEYVYEHQPPENVDWATVPNLLAMASKVKGVNTKKLSQCIVESPYNGLMNNNLRLGMKIMGGTVATPTVFINGIIVEPLTMDRIESIIQHVKRS